MRGLAPPLQEGGSGVSRSACFAVRSHTLPFKGRAGVGMGWRDRRARPQGVSRFETSRTYARPKRKGTSMNKRSFLQGLLAALGAGVAAGVSAQPQRCVLIQVSPLGGCQYYAGEAAWPSWRPDPAPMREYANPVRHAGICRRGAGVHLSHRLCQRQQLGLIIEPHSHDGGNHVL